MWNCSLLEIYPSAGSQIFAHDIPRFIIKSFNRLINIHAKIVV